MKNPWKGQRRKRRTTSREGPNQRTGGEKHMRRCARLLLIALSWLVIVPAAAYAQASITGIVKDSSGAVLPGVTVEASSPVLIEKTRSAVTDGTGSHPTLHFCACP